MTVVINKNNAGDIDELIKKLKSGSKKVRGSVKPFNALKYCGIVKVKGDALTIQKQMRDEWG